MSAYSNDDLFFQDALRDAVEASLAELVRASRDLAPVPIVGAPIEAEAKLFNCAIVIYRGLILGALATICKWLEVLLKRFFEFSQFKRSALPNAPKIGSGGSLSPRGLARTKRCES